MKALAGWPGQDSLWFTATGERNPTWDMEFTIDRLPLNLLNGFTEGSLEDWTGHLTAELGLREINGDFVGSGGGRLENAAFTLPITGVRYEGSPRLSLRGKTLTLQGPLKDQKGIGTLAVNGKVDFKAPRVKPSISSSAARVFWRWICNKERISTDMFEQKERGGSQEDFRGCA